VSAITISRIRNQYLLAILSVITELGARDVSTALVVEAWLAKNRVCDEIFFMHFDVLHSYRFLKQSSSEEQLLSLEQLLAFTADQDRLGSITHEGQSFFERYSG